MHAIVYGRKSKCLINKCSEELLSFYHRRVERRVRLEERGKVRERYRVLCIINIRGGAGSSKEKFFYDTSQFSLQEAKETLLDRTKRKLYDKWRSAGISIPFEKWSNLKEIIIIKKLLR